VVAAQAGQRYLPTSGEWPQPRCLRWIGRNKFKKQPHTFGNAFRRSWNIHTYIHTYIQTYIHTYIQTYIHTLAHIHTATYIHRYIHRYIHTYIHTHTHIHTYMHTHTYIHTYLPIYLSGDGTAVFPVFHHCLVMEQLFSRCSIIVW
jgi:hypothetical protein